MMVVSVFTDMFYVTMFVVANLVFCFDFPFFCITHLALATADIDGLSVLQRRLSGASLFQ